jgi:hypothetical protein
MKKLITIVCSICVLLIVTPALTAFAAEVEPVSEQSNVTITVVMPDTTPKQQPVKEPEPTAPPVIKVYPADVTELRDGGNWQIIKTYELNVSEKPEDIPRDSFERSGWKFTLTDIVRKEVANAETREHTETVTLNTDTKELEKILPLFTQTMEYKTEDGFVGILSLDVSSIKVETAGTSTSSYTMNVTREYPHLSTNDTSLVPKTVTDRGTNYTLVGVEWRVGNYSTVDYERIPDYYTAVATYSATGYSTKVTGYVTTAVYTGTLAKMSQGMTYYTAYFLGEEIRTPLEMVTPQEKPPAGEMEADPTVLPDETAANEPDGDTPTETEPNIEPTAAPDENNGGAGISTNTLLLVILIVVILAGGAYYLLKKKKGEPTK